MLPCLGANGLFRRVLTTGRERKYRPNIQHRFHRPPIVGRPLSPQAVQAALSTSVPQWDRQFRLIRVHHEHRKKLGRLRLACIGADAVAVAWQLGEGVPAMTSLSPAPVMLLTPLCGEAATTS